MHSGVPIWKQAMQVEMDQHNDVRTWQLVKLPMGWIAIGSRWVYAVKTTWDGGFEKAKAHLVTPGFTQGGLSHAPTTTTGCAENSLLFIFLDSFFYSHT